tara:strand:- start:22232 stop:22528 length:297 start_codon:yes stop_codon:yes gene_type:complete
MKLPYYSEEEKVKILEDMGYTVETINTYRSENAYHNKVIYTDTTSTVAYKSTTINIEEFKYSEIYKVEQKIGIKKVFKDLGELALKTLITRQIINNNI